LKNKEKVTLTSYDDIFGGETAAENVVKKEEEICEKVVQIPLAELHQFSNHPFRIEDGEEMEKLTESVKLYGIITPLTVRKIENGYEIISGNRRKRAAELAELETLPAVVKDFDDDEAIIAMVDSNLQREVILPSEKAFAYKMKLEAVKHQGKRNDITCSQVGNKSVNVVAEQSGESKNQIFRYIRLTELIPELLKMVDERHFPFNPAVEISYLNIEEQQELHKIMALAEISPSLLQSQMMKKLSRSGELNADKIEEIMSEEKKEPLRVTFTGEKLKKYFPENYTTRQIETTIIQLLEQWQKSQN
jgi:ParB family chromosome partitioning protein